MTGGAGFIGSHTVDALVADWIAARSPSLDDLSAGKRDQVNPGRASIRPICATPKKIGQIIGEARPEVIVHLAAQMDVRRSVADPAFDAQVNLVGFPQPDGSGASDTACGA